MLEKTDLGNRAQNISNAGISVPRALGARPTFGAISLYLTLEKLTSRSLSGSQSVNPNGDLV